MAQDMNGMHEGSIAHHLQSAAFPASRDELVAHVRRHSADGIAANLMELLPRRRYESAGEVMQALVTSDESEFEDHALEDEENLVTAFAEEEEDDDFDDGDDEQDDEDDEDDDEFDDEDDDDDEDEEDDDDDDYDDDDGEEVR
jgi:hypothetical protein